MGMRRIEPNDAHKALKADIDAALLKHGKVMSSAEILAIISQMCGMVLAMQDQRTMTKDAALEIMTSNIEIGNAIVIANLNATQGRA